MLCGYVSIWGHLGSKGYFHQKCYNLPMLHSMTIRFIHDDHIQTLYLCYGVMYQSGVIWGHRSQKVIFSKKASSPSKYVAMTCDLCICISLTPATKVLSLKIHSGSFGVTGIKRSFSLKKSYNSPTLHSMTIRLIHDNKLEILYLCFGVMYQSEVIWGHRVKRSLSPKIL